MVTCMQQRLILQSRYHIPGLNFCPLRNRCGVNAPIHQIAVDFQPSGAHAGMTGVSLTPIPRRAFGGNVEAAPRQQPDSFVIQARRIQHGFEPVMNFRPILVGHQHGGVLVAQYEFDHAVLM